MKKSYNIAVIAALMVMMLFTVSCGSGQDNDKASGNEVSVVISIDYPDGSGAEDVEDLAVTAAEGSSVLDVLMDYAEENGVGLRPRFSPGYGDLPLEVQKSVFAVLDCPRKIGLSLNDSLLMSPSKSVTAFAGITENEGNSQSHKCDSCENVNCSYRSTL